MGLLDSSDSSQDLCHGSSAPQAALGRSSLAKPPAHPEHSVLGGPRLRLSWLLDTFSRALPCAVQELHISCGMLEKSGRMGALEKNTDAPPSVGVGQ